MPRTDRIEIDRTRLAELIARERATLASRTTQSKVLAERANAHMIGGVPMQWMQIWAGQHAIFFERAKGNRITDVDGNELIDFCLGDTGSMAGHSPEATVAAVQRRMGDLGGVTTMLPTEDAIWVADELSRRFGMDKWTFSLTATDANRWVLRTARQLTGRPKVLIMSYCYHGSTRRSSRWRTAWRRASPATSVRRSIRRRRRASWSSTTSRCSSASSRTATWRAYSRSLH